MAKKITIQHMRDTPIKITENPAFSQTTFEFLSEFNTPVQVMLDTEELVPAFRGYANLANTAAVTQKWDAIKTMAVWFTIGTVIIAITLIKAMP